MLLCFAILEAETEANKLKELLHTGLQAKLSWAGQKLGVRNTITVSHENGRDSAAGAVMAAMTDTGMGAQCP